MNNLRKVVGGSLVAIMIGTGAMAQEKTDNGINPNSVRPIHESNIMWKTTLWRRVDLNEKQNQPFFAKNSEITKFLMEGVKAGLLTAYTSDSLNKKLTVDEFKQRLQVENMGGGLSDEEKKAGFAEESTDDGWGDSKPKKDDKNKSAAAQPAQPQASSSTDVEYFPQELNILEIKEDYVFDKQRSRMYFDIQTITIILPAAKTAKGFDVPVATFQYKELDKYFRSNPKCIWYNSHNMAQHKNMADAFDLRLFYGRIIKQSNPRDQFLTDKFGSERSGLLKSQQLEYDLMEFEHNLWEY
ncbi:MAG: gliding motility protein GldN [Spirosomataceae bacterium]